MGVHVSENLQSILKYYCVVLFVFVYFFIECVTLIDALTSHHLAFFWAGRFRVKQGSSMAHTATGM